MIRCDWSAGSQADDELANDGEAWTKQQTNWYKHDFSTLPEVMQMLH